MKKTLGFTVTELLVTLAMTAILAGLAAPSFRDMIRNNRIETASFTLRSNLSYARSEAIRLNTAVNLARTGGTTQEYVDGWQIYTDVGSPNGNTAFTSSNGDVLLRTFPGYDVNGLSIRTDTDGNSWIAYRANGTLAEGGNTVDIAICDERGAGYGQLITIGVTGQTTVTVGTPTSPITSCTP